MAGLVAGALSMAVGEYVSVSSQRDTEQADIAKERLELAATPERELAELTAIYRHKGLSPPLARQVAEELSEGDVLRVHLSEELGITDETMARPVQAMLVSAVSFAIGASLPLGAMAAARRRPVCGSPLPSRWSRSCARRDRRSPRRSTAGRLRSRGHRRRRRDGVDHVGRQPFGAAIN